MEELYDVVYAGFSFETHGYNVGMGVNVREDGCFMEIIRSPKHGESAFYFSCYFTMNVLMDIYDYLECGVDERLEFVRFFDRLRAKREMIIEKLRMIK